MDASIAGLFSLAATYVPPSTPKSLLMHSNIVVESATSAAVYQAVP